jgi:hypothetical protein
MIYKEELMKLRIGLMGVAALATLSACGLVSGPSDSTIEELARKSMTETLGGSGADPAAQQALKDAVAKATISKKGMCNNQKPDVYACMVDVTMTMPGESAEKSQVFVVEATKDAQGNWTVAD